MKYLIFIVVILALTQISCSSKPDPNLELSNPEAFSFDLGDSWEVNASVTTKGFAQKENGDAYSINLSYTVDLITPNSDSILAVFSDEVKETDSEEFMDFILEAQVEIESTFGEGNYKLIFNVKDEFTSQIKMISVDFKLTK